MNYRLIIKQSTSRTIPSNPKSVLVIYHNPYTNTQLDTAQSSSARKHHLTEWLIKHNNILKPELYVLTKLNKPRFKTFRMQTVVAEHEYFVVCPTAYRPT
jgi:hypothetical protein